MISNTSCRTLTDKERATQHEHCQHRHPYTPSNTAENIPETMNNQCSSNSQAEPCLHRKFENSIHARIISPIQEIAHIDHFYPKTNAHAHQQQEASIDLCILMSLQSRNSERGNGFLRLQSWANLTINSSDR